MKWHEMKWPAIERLEKNLPLVIPLGSVEQHGKHLPLCTDTTQVAFIADAVEEQLRDSVIMLPVLWLGSSHHHLDFPGTLSLTPTLYTNVIQQLTKSILGAGFRRLFYLNGHGGNETPTSQALTELAVTDSLARNALLAMSSWWAVGKPDVQRHGLETPRISHACEYETSLMLWLRPDLVEIEAATDTPRGPYDARLIGPKPVNLYRRFSTMTGTGNLGRATAATREKGQGILEAVVKDVVEFLDEFSKWPLPTSLKSIESDGLTAHR